MVNVDNDVDEALLAKLQNLPVPEPLQSSLRLFQKGMEEKKRDMGRFLSTMQSCKDAVR